MNATDAIQNLARNKAKIMGAWFLFYPGQSWILFRPQPIAEEPLCRFPRSWWETQRRTSV